MEDEAEKFGGCSLYSLQFLLLSRPLFPLLDEVPHENQSPPHPRPRMKRTLSAHAYHDVTLK